MGNQNGTPVPGVGTEYSASPRTVFVSDMRVLPGLHVIDGSKSRDPLNTSYVDRLRAGMLLGKITSSGKFAPSIIGVTTVAYDKDASDNTTMTVSAATATEIARRIGTSGTFKVTGPPTAGGTVATQTVTFSAVNTSTGAITISALSANAIAGSFIQPTDGSETPLFVLSDGYPVKVTDREGSSQDTQTDRCAIAGVVDASQIVNWPSNAVLRTWLVGQLNGSGRAQFTFDYNYE